MERNSVKNKASCLSVGRGVGLGGGGTGDLQTRVCGGGQGDNTQRPEMPITATGSQSFFLPNPAVQSELVLSLHSLPLAHSLLKRQVGCVTFHLPQVKPKCKAM